MGDFSSRELDESHRDDENLIIIGSDSEFVYDNLLDDNFSDSQGEEIKNFEYEQKMRKIYEDENNLAHENILRENLIVKLSNRNSEERACSESEKIVISENSNKNLVDASKSTGNSEAENIYNLQKCSVLVYGFPLSTTADSLRAFFNKFGPVLRSLILVKNEGNKFGFIEFASPKDALKCLECQESSIIDECLLTFEEPNTQVVKMLLAQRVDQTIQYSPVDSSNKVSEIDQNKGELPRMDWDASDDSLKEKQGPKDESKRSFPSTGGRNLDALDRELPPRGKTMGHRKMEEYRKERSYKMENYRKEESRHYSERDRRFHSHRDGESNSVIRDNTKKPYSSREGRMPIRRQGSFRSEGVYRSERDISSRRFEKDSHLEEEKSTFRRDKISPRMGREVRRDERFQYYKGERQIQRDGRISPRGDKRISPRSERMIPRKNVTSFRREERRSTHRDDRKEERARTGREEEKFYPQRDDRIGRQMEDKYSRRDERTFPVKSPYKPHHLSVNYHRSPQKMGNYLPRSTSSHSRYRSYEYVSSKPQGRNYEIRDEEMRLRRDKEDLKRERERLERERARFEMEKRNLASISSHKDEYSRHQPSHGYYFSSKRKYDDNDHKRTGRMDDLPLRSSGEDFRNRLSTPSRYHEGKRSYVQQYSSRDYSGFDRSRYDHSVHRDR